MWYYFHAGSNTCYSRVSNCQGCACEECEWSKHEHFPIEASTPPWMDMDMRLYETSRTTPRTPLLHATERVLFYLTDFIWCYTPDAEILTGGALLKSRAACGLSQHQRMMDHSVKATSAGKEHHSRLLNLSANCQQQWKCSKASRATS